RVDANYNAGVPLLVGTPPAGGELLTSAYPSGTLNTPLPAGTTVDIPINVPDSYLVQGVTVKLSILHQNDPDLIATLISPDGTRAVLFAGAGTSGSTPHANFINTVLDDSAAISIQQATTPIGGGPFNPKEPLTRAFQGRGALGTWTL